MHVLTVHRILCPQPLPYCYNLVLKTGLDMGFSTIQHPYKDHIERNGGNTRWFQKKMYLWIFSFPIVFFMHRRLANQNMYFFFNKHSLGWSNLHAKLQGFKNWIFFSVEVK